MLPNRDIDRGIAFEVPRRKPDFRFELAVVRAGAGWDFVIGLRVAQGKDTLAWIEQDDWFGRTEVVVANHRLGVVDPIQSGDLQVTDWPRYFLAQLAASAHSPLFGGNWVIRTPTCVRPPEQWEYPYQDSADYRIATPLRRPSKPDSGRIKWWRKVARAGDLPPVLVYYCALTHGVVVIDGHDRLAAASLEAITPDFLELSAVRENQIPRDEAERQHVHGILSDVLKRETEQRTVEGVNGALINLYTDRYVERISRAYAVPGGMLALQHEVRRAFSDVSGETRQNIEDLFWAG